MLACLSCSNDNDTNTSNHGKAEIRAVNESAIISGVGTKAIVHCRVIVGDGTTVIEDGCVVVSDTTIEAVGKFGEVAVPDGAEVIEASGMTLLPGLIDAHFHLNRLDSLPALFLKNGITSMRDPGAWIEDYDAVRATGMALPRLYLTGPHIDMFHPAYPENSFVVRDISEAKMAVDKFANQGASAIKIYFRCSQEIIRAVCAAADARGIPVTAHLEISDIYETVAAGLDGIEHITSLGTNLVPAPQAEAYKQQILQDNNARRQGRYDMWQTIDPNGESAEKLGSFLAQRNVFVCPTLGAFEYQPSGNDLDTLRQEAFQHMTGYTKKLHDLGVSVVVGSHSRVKYAETGWAFHHEMELFEKLGMEPLKIIKAATLDNAAFFGILDRLGTIQKNKRADFILVEGNPLKGIATLRNIRRVMLSGAWVMSEND
ncbi:amidohydrolase family protein [Persicitalea sp.]|uniref:amidohydrolase family protein n=1 Tax=Persicitalea sp. TaxID=3100273 RepID=UPI00359427BE